MGVDVDPVLILVTGGTIGYWVMSNSFADKLKYCSSLYNDYLHTSASTGKKEAKVIAVNMCTQLLTIDLWCHRIYSWLFSETLEEAARSYFDRKIDADCVPYKSFDEFVQVTNSGKLKISHARNLLLIYQKHLIES